LVGNWLQHQQQQQQLQLSPVRFFTSISPAKRQLPARLELEMRGLRIARRSKSEIG